MAVNRYTVSVVVFLILCQIVVPSYSQLGVTFDIKKPSQYDDRVLGSEKSDQKKFTLPRRFIQNSFTHYNYFFNANNKLNEVIELAKKQHQDDFTELLPFYNYSLDVTSQNRVLLDSVIHKATTGIVLQDRRNDWIDNMFLLMGASYYLRKDFDSAYLTFQYINYAFAEKEKDGYYKNIGSNMDGNNAFSIATREKNSLPRKVFAEQPSRNDAFIWQIRTLITLEEYAEAASLIVTLREDPVFPKRLKNDLAEVQAWWFYRNNMHDSAALYLTRALSNAPTKMEKARWEFLIAQLYEISGNNTLAKTYYEKVINHTIDPVMEIYARLHSIRINKEGGGNYIDRNISELLKMAKRDKYVDYRDVIYYTIAQMEIERNNFDAAQNYLGKSASFNSSNTSLRNKAYLQMGELAFNQKKYRLAYNLYDSIRLNDPSLKDPQLITARKKLLANISTQTEIISRQDSLQKIAGMSEEERKDYVRRIVRKLRKEQGLKEESAPGTPFISSGASTPDLFLNTTSKGEWYFYNSALRTKGANEFKARWGNRPNVDNWRRSNVMNMTASNRPLQSTAGNLSMAASESNEITFDALYARLPLTTEQLKRSNDSIQQALFTLGKILAEEVEDCNSSTTILEELRQRFPSYLNMEEVLFMLYYCYTKNKDATKAEDIKMQMSQRYPTSPFTSIINTGKDPRKPGQDPEVTKKYEQIYDLFIEGKFEDALVEKKKADDLYGPHYWTPQLLYIEAVYYIRLRQDDLALASLTKITEKFTGTPLAAKASNLINVLGRRTQIEEELRNAQVERPTEGVLKRDTTVTSNPIVNQPKQQQAPQQNLPVTPNNNSTVKLPVDTSTKKTIITPFVYKPDDKHMVALVLNKVDLVWGNETKSAFYRYNRITYSNKNYDLNLVDITADHRLLLIGPFDNAQAAVEYVQKAKPVTGSQIIPWLKGDKYSFSVITASNLELLKAAKDMNAYNLFIKQQLPGNF